MFTMIFYVVGPDCLCLLTQIFRFSILNDILHKPARKILIFIHSIVVKLLEDMVESVFNFGIRSYPN